MRQRDPTETVIAKAASLGSVLLPSLVAMAAALFFCRADIHFGDDAATYVDAARSLISGLGFATSNEDATKPAVLAPIVLWPPGYPLLIAALGTLGVDLERASLCVGLISYVGLIALCMRIARKWSGNKSRWATAAILALSPRLWEFSTDGYSDLLFSVLVVAAVVAAEVRSGRWRVPLLAATVAAAAYVRYIGVFLFPAMVAIACLRNSRLTVRQALLSSVLAGLAVTPLFLRNMAVTATVSGNRPAAGETLLENLSDAGVGVGSLYVPSSFFRYDSPNVPAFAAGVAGLCVLGVVIWVLVRVIRGGYGDGDNRADGAVIPALALVSLTYLAVMITLRSVIYFDALSQPRMLLPLVPLLSLLCGRALVDAFSRGPIERAIGLGVLGAFIALALGFAIRGSPLKSVYPDLDFVARSIRSHVPSGSCVAYEAPTSEGPWAAPSAWKIVRMRLPEYRAVIVPDTVVAQAGSNVAEALSRWGRSTGCRYFVSVGFRRRGAEDKEAWTFQRNAPDSRLRPSVLGVQAGYPPMFEVLFWDPRVSVLHLRTV